MLRTILASLVALAVISPSRADETAVPTSQRLLDAGLASDGAYRRLAWLCDRIGNRLSGSKPLEQAVVWAAAEMRKDGLDRVWTDPVKVPKWVRGSASARILAPIERDIPILALGMTGPTPARGIEGEIVAVWSLDELATLGDRVRGKIVLFMHAMERNGEAEHGYGNGSKMRHSGPVEAAKLGAKGALILGKRTGVAGS